MKKYFKGFTLVECLIALAILGVGTLIMAQIYANVSRINLNNHTVNTSLAYQMKLVEEATGTDSVPIYFGDTTDTPDSHSVKNSGDGAPPNQVSGSVTQNNYITITKRKDSSGNLTSEEYGFPVDIYVLLSRDANNVASNDSAYEGYDEKNINLRYKYIIGHSN